MELNDGACASVLRVFSFESLKPKYNKHLRRVQTLNAKYLARNKYIRIQTCDLLAHL